MTLPDLLEKATSQLRVAAGREEILDLLVREFETCGAHGRVVWVTYSVGPFSNKQRHLRRRVLDLLSSGPRVQVLCAHPQGPITTGASAAGRKRGPSISKSSWVALAGLGRVGRWVELRGWRGQTPLHAKLLLFFPNCDQETPPSRLVMGSFNLSTRALADSIETYAASDDPAGLAAVWRVLRPLLEDPTCCKAVTEVDCIGIDDDRDGFPGWELEEHTHRPSWDSIGGEFRKPPHEWQRELIKGTIEAMSGADRDGWVVELPTGAGKTVVAVEVLAALRAGDPNFRVLWIAPKHELLLGAAATFGKQYPELRDQIWLQEPEDCSGHLPGPADSFVFCTNHRAVDVIAGAPAFSIVVADECHHYRDNPKTYGKVEAWRARQPSGPRLLGLSATPHLNEFRSSADNTSPWSYERTLGAKYDKDWLTKMHFLSEPTFLRRPGGKFRIPGRGATAGRIAPAVSRAEKALIGALPDFSQTSVVEAVAEAAADPEYNAIQRLLVFAMNIKQAEAIEGSLNRSRVGCAKVIHSAQRADQQRQNLDWFRGEDDERRILVNVEMAIEGVDVPKINGIFLVRPTFSWVYHNQMIGRGLRGPHSGGTPKCLIIDFTYKFVDEFGKEILDNGFTQRLGDGPGETTSVRGDIVGRPEPVWPDSVTIGYSEAGASPALHLCGGSAEERAEAERWIRSRGGRKGGIARAPQGSRDEEFPLTLSVEGALLELAGRGMRSASGALRALSGVGGAAPRREFE